MISHIKKIFISLTVIGALSSCTPMALSPNKEMLEKFSIKDNHTCTTPAVAALTMDKMTPGTAASKLQDTVAYKHTLQAFELVSTKESLETIASSKDENIGKIEITSSDLADFADIFSKELLDPSNYIPSTGKALDQGSQNLSSVFRAYYQAYLSDKFIDRFGTKFSKPEIKKSIGNDTISAALLIFMEALADTKLRTPIFELTTDGKTIYYPSGKKDKPTAITANVINLASISTDPTECGITESEAKAIAYLSNLAGERSSVLSKLTLEAIGDIELSMVIGGHFSIGDNETLATIVTTFFEAAARRKTERAVYEILYGFRYGGGNNLTANRSNIEHFITSF